MSTPTKPTKATATQNSASSSIMFVSLAFESFGCRALDRIAADRNGAGETLDDCGCGLDRDAAYIDHRGGGGFCDLPLGLGDAGIERGVEGLARRFGLLGL